MVILVTNEDKLSARGFSLAASQSVYFSLLHVKNG